jgi:hypothetical protein
VVDPVQPQLQPNDAQEEVQITEEIIHHVFEDFVPENWLRRHSNTWSERSRGPSVVGLETNLDHPDE